MKNKILVLILLAVITMPQVASAAWWNPLSWFRQESTNNLSVEELESAITDESQPELLNNNSTPTHYCPTEKSLK